MLLALLPLQVAACQRTLPAQACSVQQTPRQRPAQQLRGPGAAPATEAGPRLLRSLALGTEVELALGKSLAAALATTCLQPPVEGGEAGHEVRLSWALQQAAAAPDAAAGPAGRLHQYCCSTAVKDPLTHPASIIELLRPSSMTSSQHGWLTNGYRERTSHS